jgi:hypothetical protein
MPDVPVGRTGQHEHDQDRDRSDENRDDQRTPKPQATLTAASGRENAEYDISERFSHSAMSPLLIAFVSYIPAALQHLEFEGDSRGKPKNLLLHLEPDTGQQSDPDLSLLQPCHELGPRHPEACSTSGIARLL